MIRIRCAPAALAFLSLALLPALLRAEEATARNVILLGWDGAQRAHLRECLDRGELPVLARLIESGVWADIEIEGTTDTKAGWAQILTGYFPEVTGVYSNRRYRPIPEGLTLFERLEAHFGSERFATLAVIGKKGHVDADPPRKTRVDGDGAKPRRRAPGGQRRRRPEGRLVEEDGVTYRVVPGKPWYRTKESMDLFVNGLQRDDVVARRAIRVLEEHRERPFFLFVHFAEVDHAGHRHGENSQEYTDALISNDFWTGQILQRIAELGLADRTLVYVTADHGFDEGKKAHRDAPHVFLVSNDRRICRSGRRQDIAPTLYEAFGLDPTAARPPLDGLSLRRPLPQQEAERRSAGKADAE